MGAKRGGGFKKVTEGNSAGGTPKIRARSSGGDSSFYEKRVGNASTEKKNPGIRRGSV